MHMLKKMDRLLERFERWIVIALFALLLVLMSLNIIARNAGGYVPQKVLAFIPHAVMWLALFGSTLALRERRHIAFNVLARLMPVRINHAAAVVAALSGVVVLSVLFAASIGFVRQEIDIFGASGWMSLVFPLFFLIALFRCFLAIWFPVAPVDRDAHSNGTGG